MIFDSSFDRETRALADPNSLFANKTWQDIGKDPSLTAYVTKWLDPDGSRFNGDVEALKQGFLNEYTRKSNSMIRTAWDWAKSGSENDETKQFQNLAGRLYESAPNRLVSGDPTQTMEALGAGLTGAIVDDAAINIPLAFVTMPANVIARIGKGVLSSPLAREAIEKGVSMTPELANAVTKKATWATVRQGAAREAAVNAGLGGGAGLLEQDAQVNRELRDETSLLEAGGNALVAGAAGGIFGGIGGAIEGRRLGRELTGKVAPDKARFMTPERFPAEGERTLPGAIQARSNAIAEAGVDDAARAVADESTAAIRANAEEYAASLRMFSNEVTAGAARSTYKPDTLARASTVLSQFTDPVRLIQVAEKARERALADGNMELAGQAATRVQTLQALGDVLQKVDPIAAFNRADQDIDAPLMDALVQVDETLAALVARDAGTPSSPAAAPAASGAAGPTAAPSKPAAAAAGPQPTQPSAPPAAATDTPEAAKAQQAAAEEATAPAPDQAPPAPPREALSDTGKSAYDTLQTAAAQAGTDADTIIARVRAGESVGGITKALTAATHTPRRVFKEALDTVLADVKAGEERAAAAAQNVPNSGTTVPNSGMTQGASEAAGSHKPSQAGSSPAPATNAAADAANDAPVAVNVANWSKGVLQMSDEAVASALARVPDILAATKEAEGGAIALDVLKSDEATAPLFRRVTVKTLGGKNPERAIARIVRENAQAQVTAIYADVFGRMLDTPLDVDGFSRLIGLIPGMSAAARDSISKGYRKMAELALADELGRVGSFDELRRIHGSQVDFLLGKPKGDAARVDLQAVVDDLVDMSVLTEQQRGNVRKIARDFAQSLSTVSASSDPDMMLAALRRRVSSAIDEQMAGDWKTNNPDAARRLENIKAANAWERDTSIWWTGGEGGTQGALFHPSRVIIDRLHTDRLGKAQFVSGRVLIHRGNETGIGPAQSFLRDTHGMGYYGALWSNPMKAYSAQRQALREIGKAALDASSNRRMKAEVGGRTISGGEKQIKGLLLETQEARIEMARWDALVETVRKLDSGEIDEAAYQAAVERLGRSPRAVTNDEIAAARDILRVNKQREMAQAQAKAELDELMQAAADGGADLTPLFTGVWERISSTMKRLDGDLANATARLTRPVDEALANGRASAEAKNDGKIKLANGDRVAIKGSDGVVREMDPAGVQFVGDDAGNVTLGGRVIGTFTKNGDSMSVNVVGIETPFDGIKSAADLLKRKRFAGKLEKLTADAGDSLPKAEPAVAQIAETGDVIPEGVTSSEKIAEAKEALNGRVLSGSELGTEFASLKKPGDRKWALRDEKTGRIWRVKDGHKTVADVVGTHAEGGQFTIGTVPWSRVDKASGEKFDPFNNEAFAKAEFRPLNADTRVSTPTEAAHIKLAETNKDVLPKIVEARNGPAPERLLAKIPSSAEGMTILDMANSLRNRTALLDFSSLSTLDAFEAELAALTKLADEVEAIAPHGIVRTNASRNTSFLKLREAMSSRSPQEIEAALEVLRRLDTGSVRSMPYFVPNEVRNSTAVDAPLPWSKTNKRGSFIMLAPNADLGVPSNIVAAHEVAHWAFLNMLSPREQLEFVGSLRKFYKEDGSLDMAVVRGSLPKGTDNAHMANELFAHQFTAYVQQVARKGRATEDAGIWTKVIKYTRAMLDYLTGRKIDPDLIPLFERILPSDPGKPRYRSDVLRDRVSGEVVARGGDERRTGLAFSRADYAVEFDAARAKLDEMLFSPGLDDGQLITLVKDSGARLWNLLNGKGARNVKALDAARAGVFGADGEETKALFGHGEMSDIVRAYRATVSKDKGDAAAFGEFIDDLEAGELVAVDMTSNPEFAREAAERGELALAEAKKRGLSDEDAAEVAWAAMKAMREEAAADTTVHKSVFDGDTTALIHDVALRLRDALSDAADSMANSVEKNGFSIVRDTRAAPAPTAPIEVLTATAKAVKKQKKKVVDAATPDADYRRMVTEASEAATRASLGLSPKDAVAAAQRSVSDWLDKALSKINSGELAGSAGTALDGVSDPAELRQELANALIDGQYDVFMEAAHRLRSAGERVSVPPQTREVIEAVQREAADNVAGLSEGVPDKAPPMLKVFLSRITHRDQAQRDVLQNLAYRIFNTLGIDSPTNADVARLVRLEGPAEAAEAPASNSNAFAALRKELRSISEYFTNKDKAPTTGLKRLAALLETDEMTLRLAEARIERMRKRPALSAVQKDALAAAESDAALSAKADALLEKVAYVTAGNIKNDSGSLLRVTAIGESVVDSVDSKAVRLADGYSPVRLETQVRKRLGTLSEDELAEIADEIGTTGSSVRGAVAYRQNGAILRRPVVVGGAHIAHYARTLSGDAKIKADMLAAELDRLNSSMLSETSPAALAQAGASRSAVLRELGDLLGVSLADEATPVMVAPERLFSDNSSKTSVAALVSKFRDEIGPDIGEALQGDATVRGIYDELRGKFGAERVDKALYELGYYGVDEGGELRLFNAELAHKLDDLIPTERPLANEDLPGAGELLFGMVADPEARPSALGMQQRLLQNAMPEPLARAMSKLIGKSPMDDGDFRAMGRTVGLGGFVMDNAKRLRKIGAKWLADLVRPLDGGDIYTARDSNLGRYLTPVMDEVDRIAGTSGLPRKAVSEVYRNVMGVTGKIPQTAEESAIARALHEGTVHLLPANERKVANKVIEFFDTMLRRQQEVGIDVGDIRSASKKHYIPQRLNSVWMAANVDESVKRWQRVFMEVDGRDATGALASARKLVHRAIEDFEDAGFIVPGNSSYAAAFGEKLFARVLNFSDADMAKYGLTDMFDTNLKSLLLTYAKSAEDRIQTTKRLGLKGHAYKTYSTIAQEGRGAAINALTKREIYTSRRGVAQNVDGADVSFEVDFISPLFRSDAEAARIVDAISASLQRDGATPGDKAAWVETLVQMYAGNGLPGTDHFRLRAEAVVNGIADFGLDGSAMHGDEFSFMDNFIQTLAGRPAYMNNNTKALRKASGAMMAFNSATLLGSATLASLPDMVMPLVRGGHLGAYLKGVVSAMKAAAGLDPATKEAMTRTGVGIEAILNENLTQAHGGSMGNLSNAFFWLNGLTPWTKAMREAATLSGFEMIRANQKIVQRERAMGRTDSFKFRNAMRKMRQLGVAALIDQPELTKLADHLDNDLLIEAVHKFVNESVFQPNRIDIPLRYQDPIGKLFFQFKSYMLMMARLSKYALTEARAGDVRPLVYLGTAGVAAGVGAAALRDVVQGRNNEEGEEGGEYRSVRDYTFSKVAQSFGLKDYEMDDPEMDRLVGWYIQGLTSMGALGLLGDLVYQTAEAADNGAYGRQKISSLIFGPSLGTFYDMLTAVEGSKEFAVEEMTDTEGSSGKKRAVVREVMQRVPILGGQVPIVESIVTDVAGEAQRQAK